MKLWEVLKEGKVGQRFKCKSDKESWDGKIYELSETDNGFCFTEYGKTSLVDLCSATINAEWIPEPRHVTFEDAINSLYSGFKVRVECEGFNPCEYIKVIDDVLCKVVFFASGKTHEESDKCSHFTYGQIINGSWYIV